MRVIIVLFLMGMQLFIYAQQDVVVIGNEYYRLAQYEAAEKQYRAALSIDAANTTAQYNLASALYQQKKYTEASELFRRLGETGIDKSTKAASYYNEGVTYSKQKELEKSIDAYKSALRQDPDDQQARENLQKALLELKNNSSRTNNPNNRSKTHRASVKSKLSKN